MNKEFIPYEQALALKELGFDEPCLASWTYKTKERIPTLYGCGALLFDTDGLITNQTEDIICSAPLYQQAFKFFRDKHKLAADIRSEHLGYYTSIVNRDVMIRIVMKPVNIFETYEEAESACLDKLIEIIKNK